MRTLLVVRGAALWVLLGATLKFVSGSPADLPVLVRDLPLDATRSFQIVLSIELAVGVFALLAPRRGVLPLTLLLVAFTGVLGWQMAQAESSCRCFGAAVTVAPAVMLGIDLAWLGLLLLVTPWRWARAREGRALAWAVPLALAAAALPWVLVRGASGPGDQRSRWVTLDEQAWVGRRLADLPLAPWLGRHVSLQEGALVVWTATCEICRDHLLELKFDPNGGMDDRQLLLVRLPSDPDAAQGGEAAALPERPEGFWVHEVELPATHEWIVTPPVHAEIHGGVVVEVRTHDDFLP